MASQQAAPITPVPQPPSADEQARFFNGLCSGPRLVARTDSETAPWERHMQRTLTHEFPASTRNALLSGWSSARDRLLTAVPDILGQHGLDWTAAVPVAVHAEWSTSWLDGKEDMLTPLPETTTAVLLIGVRAGTCSFSEGMAAATACRTLLLESLPASMEVYVAEMAIHTSAGEDDNNRGKSVDGSSDGNHRTSMADIFDATYSALHDGLRRSAYINLRYLPVANEAVLSFLPYAGQMIQPTDPPPDAVEAHRGTLGGYLRLTNADGTPHGGLYGLTSRHVAVIGPRSPDEPIRADGGQVSLQVSWGSSEIMRRRCADLKILPRGVSNQLKPLLRRLARDPDDEEAMAEIAVGERYVGQYIPALLEAMEHETTHRGAADRVIGHVAFASRLAHNEDRGWSDWALVALDTSADSQLGTTESGTMGTTCRAAPPYQTNHVHLTCDFINENLFELEDSPAMEPWDGTWNGWETRVDSMGFLPLAPSPLSWRERDAELQQTAQTPARYVIKRGGRSGLTLGELGPLKAIVRTPLAGQADTISWCWSILGRDQRKMPVHSQPFFSDRGDSGSIIFDLEGHVVAMLDAGYGADNTAADGTGEISDITLATPIDQVFEDIERQTGLTPRLA